MSQNQPSSGSKTSPSDFEAPLGPTPSGLESPPEPRKQVIGSLIMVETAFLASTSALIWLINYYFPLGPLLRVFFPIPIALSYLRWGKRTAWMTALVTALLLSVLMGPPRSLQFLVPYGLLGVLLGGLWRRRVSWWISVSWGTLVGSMGFFFQIGLLSLLLGENLWLYLNRQIMELLDWLFVKLGWLIQPQLFTVQLVAAGMVVLNTILYLLIVHLAAWLLLERLGNSIPAPPVWLQVLLDERED
jgi:uncharacterized protein YybS (DUF2232 family)